MNPRFFLLLLTPFLLSHVRAAQKIVNTKSPAEATIFFVATNGNDAWSGKQPARDQNKSDGPFATLPRALRGVHDLRASVAAEKSRPTTIFIREGSYFLREPLVLTPGDSAF